MAPGSDRSLSRRDNALFLVCVALSVVMLVKPDWGNTVTGLVRQSVLRPFLWMQRSFLPLPESLCLAPYGRFGPEGLSSAAESI